MKKRLEALKRDEKGFTLVELIVVLVILAILAALLVPALLGYIDRARNSKYLEEARSIYTALQAIQDENYAKVGTPIRSYTYTADDSVQKLITPTKLNSIDTINNRATTAAAPYGKDDFIIKSIDNMKFTSQDGNDVYAKMAADGTWTVSLDEEQKLTGDEKNYKN